MDEELAGRVRTWVDGYVRAWGSNDPAAIGALFSDGAAYYTEPHSLPWRGREEIVHNRQRRHSALGWLTPLQYEKLPTTNVA